MAQQTPALPQVALIVRHGRRSGRPLQHAAARVALWFLHDLPAIMETLLFPDNVRTPVCSDVCCRKSCLTLGTVFPWR